jgi:heat shock protein HslJ
MAGWAQPASAPSPRLAQEGIPSADTSQTSVDWPGVYQGLLPCADCEGVETMLILRADHSYTLIRRMLGEKVHTEETSGTFAWAADGGTVALNDVEPGGASRFKIGENQLWQLDSEGKMVTGPLAESYRLHKVAQMVTPPLEGIRYLLVELAGSPVPLPTGGQRPYFVLSKDGEVSGFGGCNRFFGQYGNKNGHFDLSKLASTMMACPELELESKLLATLEAADRYEQVGTSLFLYQGNAMLAKFRSALVRE